MDNIDGIIFFSLLLLLFCSIALESQYLGAISLIFSFLVIFKLLFKEKTYKIKFLLYEKIYFIFFLFVVVSLFASSLFALSLHGFIKTFIYVLFFYSASIFFSDPKNKNKILPLILFVSILASYESFVAIIQNYRGVDEISGWQDMSRINPEEVISRAYGTLKPYNPNLLAGYLLCALSSFIYLIFYYLKNYKKRVALIFFALFLINLIAIILTGCRGAYLGFALFFPILFFALIYYIHKTFGSIKNIKKRYKNIFLAFVIGVMSFIIIHPALLKRIESIFAFRADSSISFRLNVYEACVRMFLDNPILGIGVGNQNFREIYGLYMKTGFDALGSYCVFLELGVESGIFALISFILFLITLIKYCFYVCKNDDNVNQKILAFSVILLIASTMGHGLFDTVWFRPQVQFLFWTMIALLKSIDYKNLPIK